MRKTIMGACAATAVLAVGASGCGGDDDSSSDSTTSAAASISKEEFLKQGNEICAEGSKTIDEAAGQTFTGGRPTDEQITQFVTGTVLPSIESQVDGIRALGIPEGDEDQVNAFLDDADQAVEDAKADPVSVTENSTDPFADANQAARDYGLTECAG